MGIVIEKPGVLTTVQDLGRSGMRQTGLNPGGAMDRNALRLINILIGNDEGEAVLEAHFPAPEILFEADAVFAIGGAEFDAHLDERPVGNWQCHSVSKGQRLRFAGPIRGSRCYLSVAGGFNIDKVLGSRSTDLTAGIGGIEGRQLRTGDRIGLRGNSVIKDVPKGIISGSLIPRYSRFPTVRLTAGPEFRLLTAKSEQDLVFEGFTIARDSNRMGYRLMGEKLHLLHNYEMLSSPVDLGTVQLLPDGGLIVLMADHQTTGGYPRIGNVIHTDIPLLAQLTAGDGIGFYLVTPLEAEQILLEAEHDIDKFRIGRKLAAFER